MRPWEGKPPEYPRADTDVGATIVGCDHQQYVMTDRSAQTRFSHRDLVP